jgi:hypothetical protein
MLLGAISLVLFGLVFLIGITLRDGRREVAPPEISGPGRVAVSQDFSKDASVPTSGTLSVSGDTLGTSGSLNLDDFAHLSPTMRKLAQAWLDQCEETSRALDSITDPVLRAQALGYLKDREKVWAFLNRPLEWGRLGYESYQKAVENFNRSGCPPYTERERLYAGPEISYTASGEFASGLGKSLDEVEAFQKKCSKFVMAFQKEKTRFEVLARRTFLEFCIQNGHWVEAVGACGNAARESQGGDNFQFFRWEYSRTPEFGEVSTWDEELYCLQQSNLGASYKTVRSYQHLLDTRLQGRVPQELFLGLRGVGDRLVFRKKTEIVVPVSPST